MINYITKRNGQRESFNPDKLNKWAEWASKLNGVEWASIALDAVKKCHDGCSTSDLQAAMIMACEDREDEAHLYMAGRLYAGDTYKVVFGSHTNIPTLKEMFYKMSILGYWANMNYSDEELDYLQNIIDHKKDLSYIYSQLKQIREKYAVIDQVSGKCYESPQFVYMRVAMASMNIQPRDRRIEDVVNVYKLLSDGHLNAPSPYMLHFGTMHKGFASCCVYVSDDNIPSIAAGDHIAYMMTCASAGIGGTMFTRSKGDPVRKGTIKHLGKLPYYRVIDKNVNANRQAGRGGAATIYYDVLDPELEDLLKLRNPTTIEEKKIKDIDYGLKYNFLFCRKVAKNEDWMLISYIHAPDLWKAAYLNNNELFETLYNQYAERPDVPKKFVSARQIAIEYLTQAFEVGRLYEFAIDNVNSHTPFKDPIYSSNLCAEICIPTKPFTGMMDLYSSQPNGEIGLCNLMAIVAGRVKTHEQYMLAAYYALLIIDNAIEIMDYPFPSLEATAKYRRSAGVGITNLAYDMAYRGFYYDSQVGKDYMHRLAEMHSYCLHEASLKIAQEKGICEGMADSKYPDGWLPIDTYNRNVDTITTQKLVYNWEDLRLRIKANGGIRHSVLEAHMPCESSSAASNTTNSLYPIRQGVVIKTDANLKKVFIAPGWDDLKYQYQLAWDIEDDHITDMYAIFQKFTGQGISADYYKKYASDGSVRKLSAMQLLNGFLRRHKFGVKTRYYFNSAAGAVVSDIPEKGCDGGSCTL